MHFLSRLRYGVKLYDGWGREIDLKALLRKGKKVDRWVYVGKKHPVWVRLVMIPLPKKEADERVRKACLPAGRQARHDKDKRFNHSKEYYQWMRYNVFITTGDNKIWSTTEVARAYGVRWSRLRREKSSFHMQALLHEQCTEEYRAQTIIYLLLLFICLFMQKVYLPAGRHALSV